MVLALPFSHAPHIVDEQDSGPNSFKQGHVVMPWVNLSQENVVNLEYISIAMYIN